MCFCFLILLLLSYFTFKQICYFVKTGAFHLRELVGSAPIVKPIRRILLRLLHLRDGFDDVEAIAYTK